MYAAVLNHVFNGSSAVCVSYYYLLLHFMQAPDVYSSAPGQQFHFDYIMPEYPSKMASGLNLQLIAFCG